MATITYDEVGYTYDSVAVNYDGDYVSITSPTATATADFLTPTVDGDTGANISAPTATATGSGLVPTVNPSVSISIVVPIATATATAPYAVVIPGELTDIFNNVQIKVVSEVINNTLTATAYVHYQGQYYDPDSVRFVVEATPYGIAGSQIELQRVTYPAEDVSNPSVGIYTIVKNVSSLVPGQYRVYCYADA